VANCRSDRVVSWRWWEEGVIGWAPVSRSVQLRDRKYFHYAVSDNGT
jgi:hypothetical protein